MAPLVRVSDFPVVAERARLESYVTIPLAGRGNRRLHRWVEGGLCQAVLKVSGGDEMRANDLARRTALNAMERDPLGVARLAWKTYTDFFRPTHVNWALQLDAGHFVEPTGNDVAMIRSWFGVDARNRRFDSLTKRLEGKAALWCSFLVVLPLLFVVYCFDRRRAVTGGDVLLAVAALCTLASAIGPVEIANPRYLVPLPWIGTLMLGVFTVRAIEMKARKRVMNGIRS